jgi:type II secretory pathway component HofQ
MYGQPGFVGEPINLNVVNADIRDILNYITEQYGVNFVIDSSVGPVLVTVNVQDVPWNVALEAVLRANVWESKSTATFFALQLPKCWRRKLRHRRSSTTLVWTLTIGYGIYPS